MFTINLILNKQFGLSALLCAAKKGYPQLVTFLMENGAFKEITDKVLLIHNYSKYRAFGGYFTHTYIFDDLLTIVYLCIIMTCQQNCNFNSQ